MKVLSGSLGQLATIRWAILGLLILALVGLYLPSWSTMTNQWLHSETYSHGILIAPITAWLIWRQRNNLNFASNSGVVLGLFGMLASGLVWAAGWLISANLLQHVGLVGMVISLFPMQLGMKLSLQLAFPILFLLFMVPAGEFLNPVLMDYTADATVWALRFSGVPVYREGLHFALPTGRWSVVEACSGLRYIIAALVLALIFAYLNFRTWKRKLVFVAMAIFISIFANYLRAYVVVLVGHLSDMKHGVGDDHVWFGWAFFGVVMLVVAWAGGKYADAPQEPTAKPLNPTKPLKENTAWLLPAIAALLAMFVIRFVPEQLSAANSAGLEESTLRRTVAKTQASWVESATGFKPAFLGERSKFQGYASFNDSRVDIYTALWSEQSKYPKMLTEVAAIVAADDTRWSVRFDKSRDELAQSTKETHRIGEMEVYRGESKRLVWYWYTVGGVTNSSKTKAKLSTLTAVINGFGDASALSTLAVDLGDDIEKARDALRSQFSANVLLGRQLTTGWKL